MLGSRLDIRWAALVCVALVLGAGALTGCGGSGGASNENAAEVSPKTQPGEETIEGELHKQEAEAKKREAAASAEASRHREANEKLEAEAEAEERAHKKRGRGKRGSRHASKHAGRKGSQRSSGGSSSGSRHKKTEETPAEKAARLKFAREEATEVAAVKRLEHQESVEGR
jgi:hypothetical protein